MLHYSKLFFLTCCLLCAKAACYAQTDQIEKVWYNQEKTSKIQVYKAKDGHYYGKIIWLRDPLKDGKPKVDDQNPDASKRNTPIIGLLIMRHLEKTGTNTYENGKIYDPKNGKTYSCKITYNGNSLDLRGFIGISLIGRTSTWTVAD